MPWKTILVPHDFSASANHAAAAARDLAKLTGARIVLLHVIELPYHLPPDMLLAPEGKPPLNVHDYVTSVAEEHAQDLAKRLAQDGVAVSAQVRAGSPATEILQVADNEHADLIVMGTHGHSGLHHLLVGSTTERVVRMSPHPVLTIRDVRPAQSSV